jgi:hypothetical protein
MKFIPVTRHNQVFGRHYKCRPAGGLSRLFALSPGFILVFLPNSPIALSLHRFMVLSLSHPINNTFLVFSPHFSFPDHHFFFSKAEGL